MDAAWERGIRWFDTADAYGGGRSESFIGRWRAEREPEGLLLTTKVFHSVRGEPGDTGLGRRPDQAPGRREPRAARGRPDRPLPRPRARPGDAARRDDRRLRGASRRGRIGAWGLSNYDAPASRRRSLTAARRSSRTRTRSSSAATRQAVLPLCGEHGIAYVPFGPLAGGWLTGRYTPWHGVPARLADDAAARSHTSTSSRTASSTGSTVSPPKRRRAASTARPWPSRGCSRNPASPAPSAALRRPDAPGARARARSSSSSRRRTASG